MSTRPEYEPLSRIARLAARSPKNDPYQEAARRRRWRIIAACVVVLVAAVAFVTWEVHTAATHYERGRHASAAGRYAVAIQEFNSASILGFSYRDATERAAAAALNADLQRESVAQSRTEQGVLHDVRLAFAQLASGDAAGTERALADARQRVPSGPLSEKPVTVLLLRALSQRLDKLGRTALAAGRWRAASLWAAALLHIDGKDAAAKRLQARARRGARLQERLGQARAAARDGQWQRALRLARAVLDEWPGFTGAAALVREAQAALAPRPRPTPAPVVTATAPPAPPPAPPAPSKPTPPPP